MYREAKARLHDPVPAWADVVDDPERTARYQNARGKGGLVRADWDEVAEIIAAAHVHTIKRLRPGSGLWLLADPRDVDGLARRGRRFMSLIGGAMLSFYDWYADLPVASPQVFGDQTDVPESADWFNACYLIMWGSNVPVTRTPDAHFMTEARYRGQKVVVVSPRLRRQHQVRRRVAGPAPGYRRRAGDGHGARAPQGVLRRPPGAAVHGLRQAVHRLALPGGLREQDGAWVPDKFVTAADLGDANEDADCKTGAPRRGHRSSSCAERLARPPVQRVRAWVTGTSTWGTRPGLSLHGADDTETAEVLLPRFDLGQERAEGGGVMRRGVPACALGDRLVTTVFDLMLAQYGVARDGLAGRVAERLRRPASPTRRHGRRRSPASRPRRPSGSGASSPRTPRIRGGRSMILHGCRAPTTGSTRTRSTAPSSPW